MSKLQTQCLDLTFPNPFILASTAVAADPQFVVQALEAGWGGAVLGIMSNPPREPQLTKPHIIRSGRTGWGWVGLETGSVKALDEWRLEIQKIRSAFPDRPLIASITGDRNPETWGELVQQAQLGGVQAFEIHAGIPGWDRDGHPNRELGQDDGDLTDVVGWVRQATEYPIFVKLSPNVTDLIPIARAALEAGADGLTTTSGLSAIGGIDLTTLSPLPKIPGPSISGMYDGPGLRPVALRWTAAAAKAFDVPIFGTGGVATWQDAVEFLALGAFAVQVGIAADWQGIQMIEALIENLQQYMDNRDFSNLDDIIGKSLPAIVGFDELDLSHKLVATLDEYRCTGCELCLRACRDGGYQAISMVENVAHIDPSKCDGCGLCVYVCPEDIITMVPKHPIESR